MVKRIIAIFLVCLFIFSLVSCNRNLSNEQDSTKGDNLKNSSSNVISIASVTPLSGSQASIGEAIKNGAQMALEERKAEFKEKGFELKFSPQDDQSDPKVGVSVAQKLISDTSVLGNVAHFNSGVAVPASEIYKTDNLLMLSPANTAVEITNRGIKCVNRIVASDDVQGAVGAKFSFNNLNAKKAFVIHDKTTYGQGVAEEFKKAFATLGGEILGFEGITAGETDFNGVLTKVASENPDVLYFGGIYPEGSLIIKQMKEKNIKAKFVGPDGMDSAEVVKIAGESSIGNYYTSTAGDSSKTEIGKAWAKKYEKTFNKKPENYAAYGYDAMQVVLNAVIKAIEDNNGEKPTRLMVTEAIKKIKLYEGIATKVILDEKGDNKEAVVFVYEFKKAEYPADMVYNVSAKEILANSN